MGEGVSVLASVRGLTKRYGSVTALDAVSVSVSAGEVVGLIGPNGAGKSTLIRCLAGLVRPTEGTVSIRRAREGRPALSFVYESDALPPDMTVGSFLACEAVALGVPIAEARTVAGETGLAGTSRTIGRLSLGNRRRVALAAAILGTPDLLVMDEPTNGLDIEGLQMVRALIAERKELGRGVLFSSHTMAEVERVADRVVVIQHGCILFDGSLGELLSSTGAARLEDGYEALLEVGGPWR